MNADGTGPVKLSDGKADRVAHVHEADRREREGDREPRQDAERAPSSAGGTGRKCDREHREDEGGRENVESGMLRW